MQEKSFCTIINYANKQMRLKWDPFWVPHLEIQLGCTQVKIFSKSYITKLKLYLWYIDDIFLRFLTMIVGYL